MQAISSSADRTAGGTATERVPCSPRLSLGSKGTTARSLRPAGLLALALAVTLLLGVSSASAAPPTVTIQPASEVGVTTAHVSGTLDPADHETSYHFEFISNPAFQAQDEQQRLTVSATAGTYTLSFAAQSTAAIAFNAAASELEASLNALSTIGGTGASVTVTGGPGDEAGSAPYTITFGAALAGTDVEQISSDPSALTGGSQSANPETTVEGRPEGFQGAAQQGFGSLPAGAGETPVPATLEGLLPNTTYHLRLYAENTGVEPIETAEATAATFTTAPATAPVLTASSATEVSYLRATLHGSVDPQGGNVNPTGPPGEEALPIYWQLQYREAGTEGWATGGGEVIEGAAAESSGPIPIEAPLLPNTLQPAKTYEVRAFAYYLSFSREASSPEPVPSFETLAVAKPTASIEAVTTFSAHTAQLIGHITPNSPAAKGSTSPAEEEAFLTHYHFQCEPECPGLEGEVQAGKDPEEVSKEATGLIPGHFYSVSLFASNSGGEEPPAGPAQFTTEALPPQIDATFATAVSETEATLGAKVNPGGADTTVHFEYTSTDFSACSPTGPDCFTTPESSLIGSDVKDHTVEATVQGLEPDTAYSYRVVATNEKSPSGLTGPTKVFHTSVASKFSGECPENESLRRQNNSTALPDCRAYEQVSPVDKNGVSAYPPLQGLPAQTSATGDKVFYGSHSSFAGAMGNTALIAGHVSTRAVSGWQTEEWTPPVPNPEAMQGYFVGYSFSEDLTEAVLFVPRSRLAPGTDPYAQNLFLRNAAGEYSLVNTAPAKHSVKELCPSPTLLGICWAVFNTVVFDGASTNFSHIIFESEAQFVEKAPGPFIPSLYEKSGEKVRLVGFLPDGNAAAASFAGAGNSETSRVEHAISADGSHIIFSAPADEGLKPAEAGQAGLTEVYDRIEGKETIELSAPNPGTTPENPAAGPATFWAASKDGSRVFFTSAAELTTQSKTGDEGGEDLYEYDFGRPASESLADLSVADSPHGARVLGVVDAADDGTYIYFVAQAQLDGSKGTDGQPNLYMSHAGGAPVFIATLSASGSCTGPEHSDPCDWTQNARRLQAYVTPDGKYMAFMSTQSLPTENFPEGYDNTDQKTGEADSEVYVYSAPSGAEEGQLACGSCDLSGAQPLGHALLGGFNNIGHQLGRLGTPVYRPNALSENGARLFYTAPDPNAKAYYGVFEYEQRDEGSCTDAGGCQYQISTPGLEENQDFLGSAHGGRDVFFSTRSRLSLGDEDESVDVYDAREDGGFPATVIPTPPCEGEGCAGPGSTPPPGSATTTNRFTGPEEGPKYPKCGKGRVKRHGVCHERNKRKKHKHRAKHQQKGSVHP